MRREIARLHRELGTTMIYVTHDQVEAMTLGDRIVVLRDGQVQQVDRPSTLYAAPASVFVAGFIGSPAMNILRGTVHGRDGAPHIVGSESLDLPVPPAWRAVLTAHPDDTAVLIGVRPEHITWRASPERPRTDQHVEHRTSRQRVWSTPPRMCRRALTNAHHPSARWSRSGLISIRCTASMPSLNSA